MEHQRGWCSRKKGIADVETAGFNRWSTSVRRHDDLALGRLSQSESDGGVQGKRPRFGLFLVLSIRGFRIQDGGPGQLQQQYGRRQVIATQAARRLELIAVTIGFRETDFEVRLRATVFGIGLILEDTGRYTG